MVGFCVRRAHSRKMSGRWCLGSSGSVHSVQCFGFLGLIGLVGLIGFWVQCFDFSGWGFRVHKFWSLGSAVESLGFGSWISRLRAASSCQGLELSERV